MDGNERLQEAIRRFNATRSRQVRFDEKPGCIFGLLTRDQADDLRAAVTDLREEMRAMKRLLSGAFVALALTFIGVLIDIAVRAVR